MDNVKISNVRMIFGMMINPASVLKSLISKSKWQFSLIISGLAFALFFLQTGLDLFRTGQKTFSHILILSGTGLIYGAIIIPLVASFMWLILKAGKSEKSLFQTISVFCMSYSGALIYGVIGLGFSLSMGWKTAVAFGVTGVLWAIGPMIVSVRELTGGKNSLSIPIATIFSLIVLVSWAFIGNM